MSRPDVNENKEHEPMNESGKEGRRSFVGKVATTIAAGMVLGAERAEAGTDVAQAGARSAPPAPQGAVEPAQILEMIRRSMGEIPPAIEKSVPVDPRLIVEHARSRMFAMPGDKPALDEATRTLIYLAAALAGSSPACVRAMANRVVVQGIPREQVIETVHIVRLAMATKIIGDSEPVFDALRMA